MWSISSHTLGCTTLLVLVVLLMLVSGTTYSLSEYPGVNNKYKKFFYLYSTGFNFSVTVSVTVSVSSWRTNTEIEASRVETCANNCVSESAPHVFDHMTGLNWSIQLRPKFELQKWFSSLIQIHIHSVSVISHCRLSRQVPSSARLAIRTSVFRLQNHHGLEAIVKWRSLTFGAL